MQIAKEDTKKLSQEKKSQNRFVSQKSGYLPSLFELRSQCKIINADLKCRFDSGVYVALYQNCGVCMMLLNSFSGPEKH